MLLELALWLGKDARFFNVFGYLTLRTMLAAGTALAVRLRSRVAAVASARRWLGPSVKRARN